MAGIQYSEIIDKYYPAGTPLRDIFLSHSRCVANLALEINRRSESKLPEDEVETAAMLHDIGVFLTDAPGIECHGSMPYICHGYLGADLLRKERMDEKFARVCERHTGTGLTPEEITEGALPLPADRSYLPETRLERLICYADKFFSKSGDMKMKPMDKVETGMKRYGEGCHTRFLSLRNEFGDVTGG